MAVSVRSRIPHERAEKTGSQRFLRLEQLADVPKGKVVYHFETVDMARAKKILGETACISGNLSATLLESGTKERVADQVKWAYRHLRAGRRIYF